MKIRQKIKMTMIFLVLGFIVVLKFQAFFSSTEVTHLASIKSPTLQPNQVLDLVGFFDQTQRSPASFERNPSAFVSDEVTVFVVLKHLQNGIVLQWGDASPSLVLSKNKGQFFIQSSVSGAQAVSFASNLVETEQNSILVLRAHRDLKQVDLYLNGESLVLTSDFLSNSIFVNKERAVIFESPNSANILESAIYSRALNEDEVAKLSTYFSYKWQIPIEVFKVFKKSPLQDIVKNSLSYDKDIYPIFNQACSHCHSIEYNFKSPEQILGSVAHLPGYSPMPSEDESLSEDQMALIQSWVEQGAQP